MSVSESNSKSIIASETKSSNSYDPRFLKDQITTPQSRSRNQHLENNNKNRLATKRVFDLIESIGDIRYTEIINQRIQDAKNAYMLLSAQQKKHVTNHAVLVAAEQEFDKLSRIHSVHILGINALYAFIMCLLYVHNAIFLQNNRENPFGFIISFVVIPDFMIWFYSRESISFSDFYEGDSLLIQLFLPIFYFIAFIFPVLYQIIILLFDYYMNPYLVAFSTAFILAYDSIDNALRLKKLKYSNSLYMTLCILLNACLLFLLIYALHK